MDRRNFFKIVSTVSAGLATNACGNKSNQLIPLLVPDHEIVPGEEVWRTAVCTECGAGCGTIVRVMEGERVIERNGQKFRERVACIKKIEGNPLDPISGGRLCARGHAALQSLYNPDRLTGPLQRSGDRGKAEFKAIAWDEAIAGVAQKLRGQRSVLFLTSPQPSARSTAINNFLSALGAPPALSCSLTGLALEYKAAELVYGWNGLPTYDIAHAHYVLGIGADFLGGWASPVYYARQFGQFRQGRPEVRGRLVQAESRMSITAASADEWLPVRPGAELQLTLAVARILLDEKLAKHSDQLPAPIAQSIAAADLAGLIKASGIDEKRVRKVARSLGESEAPLVIAGASVVHTNSVSAIMAGHYLNIMLGAVARPPGSGSITPVGNVSEALKSARIILLDGQNPAFTLPLASGAIQALSNAEMVVSFGHFVDDSSAYADFILPDNHPLEGEAVRPLYNTRALQESLTAIAHKLDVAIGNSQPSATSPQLSAFSVETASYSGSVDQFPLEFQPYVSLQYHDGSGANLPWMQELPDPTSSAMWDLPVEIDPTTASRMKLTTSDRVRVESPHGAIEAWAYVHPAALPGVVSMAIGQGHTHYGRYASGRGANPLAILAPVYEPATGALVTGGTRVRLARLENASGEFIQFAPLDREQGPWGHR